MGTEDRSQNTEHRRSNFSCFMVFRHRLSPIKGIVVFITKSTMIFCDGLVIVLLHPGGVPDRGVLYHKAGRKARVGVTMDD